MTAKPVEPTDRQARDARMVELYDLGLSIHDVAAEIGLSPSQTHRLLNRAGVLRPHGGGRGGHRLQPGQLTWTQMREYEQRMRERKWRR